VDVQCYCGNTLGAQASATDCNVACAGDATQMCGGSWRLSVYAATSAASSTTAPQTTTKSSSTVPVASPTSTASISKRGLGFNYVSATTPFANT
jgi:glucan endo-1,3-alpha-glucosidase